MTFEATQSYFVDNMICNLLFLQITATEYIVFPTAGTTFKGHARSSAVTPFERHYTISYECSTVTVCTLYSFNMQPDTG